MIIVKPMGGLIKMENGMINHVGPVQNNVNNVIKATFWIKNINVNNCPLTAYKSTTITIVPNANRDFTWMTNLNADHFLSIVWMPIRMVIA